MPLSIDLSATSSSSSDSSCSATMQWCSEEVSEDSDAGSASTTPGSSRKGKTKVLSVSAGVLRFLGYSLSYPLFTDLLLFTTTLYPGLRRHSTINLFPIILSLYFAPILVAFR